MHQLKFKSLFSRFALVIAAGVLLNACQRDVKEAATPTAAAVSSLSSDASEEERMAPPSPEPINDSAPAAKAKADRSKGLQAVSPPAAVRQAPAKKAEQRADRLQLAQPVAPNAALGAKDGWNTERYDHIQDNDFVATKHRPLSTFSIDVDTASYSNVRRMLREGREVVPGAVRIEEMINYFSYDYPQPSTNQPFSVTTEVATAPWAIDHQLVLIGLKGKSVPKTEMPPRNLVFLLDVSGSMESPDKLPLLKRSFSALLDNLNARDRVAIVVYAGASGLVLPSTLASDRSTIFEAFDNLSAGGSTNGAAGIQLAYDVAEAHLTPGSINRVILATDGDFNVGTTSQSELVDLIEKKRESGVFLTVLGFGMGNYNDSTLEKLADKGNGNYAYIDTLREAEKVLVQEAGGTLMTIAKDVKIQVEFNPAVVGAYRLIGYENRKLRDEDFNDDKKDAGDIGAGHSVTALYEVMSPERAKGLSSVDQLQYQRPTQVIGDTAEMLTVKLRYKHPTARSSQLLTHKVKNAWVGYAQASENLRFAASVAGFGMLLRNSPHKGTASTELVQRLASSSLGADPHGYRHEFLSLLAAPGTSSAMAVAR